MLHRLDHAKLTARNLRTALYSCAKLLKFIAQHNIVMHSSYGFQATL